MEMVPDSQTLVWWIAAIAFAAPLFAGGVAILFDIVSRERSCRSEIERHVKSDITDSHNPRSRR
jgi:hypothetical protein